MIILSLCWYGLILRHPQMQWSFVGITAEKATRTIGAARLSQR